MRIVSACALSLLCGLFACTPQAGPKTKRSLSIWVIPAQVPAFSTALAHAFSSAIPDLDVRFTEKDRGLDYVKALQRGEADIAFLFSDTAYLAFAGELDGQRYDQLRGVAVLDPSPVYVVVRGGSEIRSIEDLRGQRVDVGAISSSTALIAETVLNALSIAVAKSHDGFAKASTRLADGTLDAAFVIGNFPQERFNAALNRGARIISFSRANMEQLQRRHPFVRPILIRAGTLEGTPVLTIALDRLMVCRSGLDGELVYEVTRSFFAALPDLAAAYTPLRQTNADDAPATPIPLHEGASRYYREQASL